MEDYVTLIIRIDKPGRHAKKDNNATQHYIDRCIKNMNLLFSERMQCDVIFCSSDELQGLFNDVISAVLYVRMIDMLLNPVNIKAGIGVGEASDNASDALKELHTRQLQSIRICSDKYNTLANYLINASLPLRRQQISMQNVVQIFVEMLYPFVLENASINQHDVINELLADMYSYKLKSRYIDREDIPEIKPIYIDGKLVDKESVVIKRNTANTIAKILHSSRQNADTIMRRGNIHKIRELDYVALQCIARIYG